LPVREFRTFNARGGPYALDCGDALETGESFWGEGLHCLPAALKLIDIRDELQDFGGNGYVLDLVHGANIHFNPFSPIFTRFLLVGKQISIHTHFHPFSTQKEAVVCKEGTANCQRPPETGVRSGVHNQLQVARHRL
jgi:hypothetical protein